MRRTDTCTLCHTCVQHSTHTHVCSQPLWLLGEDETVWGLRTGCFTSAEGPLTPPGSRPSGVALVGTVPLYHLQGPGPGALPPGDPWLNTPTHQTQLCSSPTPGLWEGQRGSAQSGGDRDPFLGPSGARRSSPLRLLFPQPSHRPQDGTQRGEKGTEVRPTPPSGSAPGWASPPGSRRWWP